MGMIPWWWCSGIIPPPLNANGNSYLGQSDTNEYKDYFVIYDAMPDSFPLVGSTQWSPFDPYRMLHLKYHAELHRDLSDDSAWFCCGYNPKDKYLLIYEYYFDSAIIVEDSFYVGGTAFGADDEIVGTGSGLRTSCWNVQYADSHPDPCEAAYYIQPGGPGTWANCTLEPGVYKVKCGNTTWANQPNLSPSQPVRPFASAPWEWFTQSVAHFLIYPLIEVDTTVPLVTVCLPVGNVQALVSGTTATVTWDDYPYYSRVLLRYGKANLPRTQWTELDVTGNTLSYLTGLEPGERYGVTMKAECDTCKKETPWSAPIYFITASDTTGGEGIGEVPTLLSQLTFLQPNPARDEVRVTSSFSLNGIDIWTADGVMVYHGGGFSHEAVLDVSWLRAGTYIVAIHTHNGTTHKRLVITR